MTATTAFTERVALLCRMVVPYIFLILLFILNVVSFSFSSGNSIKPAFFLMGLYYWAIFRPTLIPVWLVFLCGLLLDLLNGYPPGLNALIFVMVRWAVSDSRPFLMSQPFVLLWLVFGMVCLATAAIQWAICSLLSHAVLPFVPIAASIGLGMGMFPLVCVFLHLTHKALPAPPGKFVS